jgi:hypothetical protein
VRKLFEISSQRLGWEHFAVLDRSTRELRFSASQGPCLGCFEQSLCLQQKWKKGRAGAWERSPKLPKSGNCQN